MESSNEYLAALSRLDSMQVEAEQAQARIEQARAEVVRAEQDRQRVEAEVRELWVRLAGLLGRRGRELGPPPAPDRLASARLSSDGLLTAVAADIGEPPVPWSPQRLLRLLALPVIGATCGSLGYLICWSLLHTFGVSPLGALGLVGLLLGPLAGMVLGVLSRPRTDEHPGGYHDGGPEPVDQPEPWEVLLALVPALAAEAVLFLTMR